MNWCCLYCKQPDHFGEDEYQKSQGKGKCALPPLDRIMTGMARGTIMYKVRNPDRCFRRKYKVDIQNMRLSYSPSNKPFWRGKITTVFKCVSNSNLGKNLVDLYELEEVRKGWNSDVFNRLEAKFRHHLQATFHPQLRSMLKEENCFSLVVGPSHAVVDLIAPTAYTRDAWVRGLNHVMACCKSAQQTHEYDRWLKEQVRKADVNSNGSLNFEECLTLLNQLNISMRRKDAKTLFDASNFKKVKIDGEDALDPEEFVHFYRSLIQRPEIEDLMKKYSVSRSTLWGPEELQNFLHKEQKVIASPEECTIMIDKFEPDRDKIEGYMSIRGFQEMLLSVDHNIFNKKHHIIYQDMTQPLSHYYIASSHNTYLVQDQLIGDSSIEGYIRALMSGCRCIELDTWDGPDDEPIIFHGYTLTTRILFRDVLDAIKQYAFAASQYPVILSIENHCGVSQQIKMANYFTSILGDYLYKGPVDDKETQFPSPEALARKILIKAKRLKDTGAAEERSDDEGDREKAYAVVMAAPPPPPTNDVTMANNLPPMEEGTEGGKSLQTDETMAPHLVPSYDDAMNQPLAGFSKPKEIAKELSDLVNYCSARKFESFEDCRASWKFYEMASFQETTALNLEGGQFVSYNNLRLSRIYPKGTRADSSNYDPVPYWNLGCQIVALNYQTDDEHMFIHNSKFAQNGKCGYILKPKYLRDNDVAYNPSQSPHPGYERNVIIKVISGQYLPKPGKSLEGEVVDPYVSIKVSGHPKDVQKKKTKYVPNNGFNPVWNETVLLNLQAPELAMITFRVKDRDAVGKNELLGQFALPYTSMTEGYRYVHLQDSKGQPLTPATIFVHVQIVHNVAV